MFGLAKMKQPLLRRMPEVSGALDGAFAVTTGLLAGTRVATRQGWCPVEGIAVGDAVLTLADGLQPVTQLRHHRLACFSSQTLPLQVPAGALGNRAPLWLLPDQAVVIENDLSETLVGDPWAAIPAHVLEGLLGIARSIPGGAIDVVTLGFANEQVVFTNSAALLHCPADDDAGTDPFRAVQRRSYPRVPAALAPRIARAVALDFGRTAP